MEQIVRVRKCNPDGTAEILHVRQSACSGDCHKCSGCGAARETLLFTARNPIGAEPGALVTVRTDSGSVLLAAAVLYLLPMVLFFAFYCAGHILWRHGGLAGCLGFLVGIGVSVLYDRLVLKKKKSTYTITGYAQMPPNTWEKGDNECD